MRVRAAVLREAGAPLALEPLELDAPREDEVLVRMVAAGVCHTDLRAAQGGLTPLPIVLGHEGAGVVAAVGPQVRALAPGDPVLLTFDSCGACPTCRRGAPSYCHELLKRNFGASARFTDLRKRAVHGGFFGQSSFATHALATERNAIKVARGLPLELLAPLGCGIQTGVGAVLRSLRVRAGASIAIYGAGSVGLAAVMGARIAGADPITVVDRLPERLAIARRLGATRVTLDAREAKDVDFALDTSGAAELLEIAIAGLAPLGVCGVVASTAAEHVRFSARHLLAGGRSVRGVSEGDSEPHTFIPELIQHFQAGRLPLQEIVRPYAFHGINDALRDASAGIVVKPVLRFDEE